MSCYSDHDEDVRTKGSCDYCGSTRPEPDRRGQYYTGPDYEPVSPSPNLPGDVPDEIGPSGIYGWRVVDPVMPYETEGPVVQVVEATNGKQWIATPARYYASQMVALTGRLAIDQGMGWHLPTEDTPALAAFARRVLAESEAASEAKADRDSGIPREYQEP